MAKTFDGPPTLERSGSEHRRAVTSPLPEEEGLGEKVELPLAKGRRRDSKKLIIRTKDKQMNIVKTNIEGVLIIEPRLFRDARGYFFESFSEREFEEKVAPILGHSVHFCQDNESMSSYGVMRGLHF